MKKSIIIKGKEIKPVGEIDIQTKELRIALTPKGSEILSQLEKGWYDFSCKIELGKNGNLTSYSQVNLNKIKTPNQ
jgi:hypothetical protein